MTSLMTLAAANGGVSVGTGEAITFWILAPIALAAAVAMVLSKSAVHAALLLVADLFCVAVFYAAQQAPFLAAVQVIVYTGAIMILFLFVLMLVGVDTSDSLIETLRGQRIAAVVAAVGFAGLLTGAIANAVVDQPSVGLAQANANGNVTGIAVLLFSKYVFPFEVTSALLITAALGAMVLAHKERTGPKLTQKDMSRQRFAGTHPAPLPGPGVYALHDAVDTPALLPDGGTARESVASSLRGDEREPDGNGPGRLTGTAAAPARPSTPALDQGEDET